MEISELIIQLKEKIEHLSSELKKLKEELNGIEAQYQEYQCKKNVSGGNINEILNTTNTYESAVDKFVGLKIMHILGIVTLVIGLAISVKYAIDKKLISETTRIIIAYTAGSILLGLSLLLKRGYLLFSSILFSGAMATLYFTTYAAYTYYHLYSFNLSFSLMLLVTLITYCGASLYNRQEIGLLGLVGAYGIPFLISKNSENADLLFSYIGIINVGVTIISLKKQWREMVQLGLFVTWTLIIGWLLTKYSEQSRTIAIVVIIFFYVLFLFNFLFLRNPINKARSTSSNVGLIINNLALFIASLILLNRHIPFVPVSIISFFIFIIFILISSILYRFFLHDPVYKIFLLGGLGMFCIFITFYWSGMLSTLICVLLGTTLFLLGLFKSQLWLRYSATIVMAYSLCKLLIYDLNKFSSIEKMISFIFIGILLLTISFFYQKQKVKSIKH